VAVGRWWRSAVMSNQTRTPNATTSPNVIRLAAIRVAAIGLATLGLAVLTSTGFTATALAVEPTLALTEDGSAFVYKSRPGDQPGSVAAMFGIAPRDMPAFFAANGITDPTHVGIGHVYRIPNPLAQRAAQAEAQAQAFARDVASLKTRTEQLGHELDGARTAAADAEQRVAHLARYERLWPLVSIVGIRRRPSSSGRTPSPTSSTRSAVRRSPTASSRPNGSSISKRSCAPSSSMPPWRRDRPSGRPARVDAID